MKNAEWTEPVATDYVSAAHIRPRADNVLVKWVKPPEMTKSGLVALPKADFARDIDGKLAEVVSVGPGPSYKRKCDTCGQPRDRFAMAVNVGDKVIVDNRYCGELVFVNGEEHRIVREAEILGVIEE